MKIDHASPMPLHAQVEQLIRGLLAEKRYQDGELLPPEALMAEKLAVSRNTVHAAISRLVHEGMLERKTGRGTRYVKQPLQTNLRYWLGFTTEMKRKGVKVEIFSLHTKYEKADGEIAAILHLTEATKKREILRMDRTRSHGGIPAVHSVSWFHPRTKITTEEDYSTPLYALVQRKSGITVVYSEEQISAICVDEQLAGEVLDVEGDASLRELLPRITPPARSLSRPPAVRSRPSRKPIPCQVIPGRGSCRINRHHVELHQSY